MRRQALLLSVCPVAKALDAFLVAGDDQDVAGLETIGRDDVLQNVRPVLDGNDIQIEMGAQINLMNGFADQRFGREQL